MFSVTTVFLSVFLSVFLAVFRSVFLRHGILWRRLAFLLSLFFTFGVVGSAQGQDSASGDHVSVRWLAPDEFGPESETIGFYFEVDPGWHVYWRNAGDSGAAPRFEFDETGAEVGEIRWPFPVRLPIEHLTNLGYEGDVAYLFDVMPKAGAVDLKVNLEWLVCKIDCIPGFGTMSLSRPVKDTARWSPEDRALRDRFLARVPRNAQQSPWRFESLRRRDNQLQLTLSNHSGDAFALPPSVFPLDGALLTAAEPRVKSNGKRLQFLFTRVPGAPEAERTGFVVATDKAAWQFDALPVTAGSSGTLEEPAQPLWLLVLAAFVGGAILNLMPCVFPVLSIKLFGLLEQGAHTGTRVREGLRYSAGVLVTFAALGALLLALRAGGAAIGWGFQLQSPVVVLGLIVLFWLMALSFSGVFEFGHHLMQLAGQSRGGSFATGVLAVFVAAPCTGPFMGAALGAAAVLPAASALAIFLGLGAGLAAPFLLLCASPGLVNLLPAPGAWMERVRQLLAFPLYATVIWLLWVLGRMLGESGWLIGSLLLLGLAFALWLGNSFRRVGKIAGYAVALLAVVVGFGALRVPPQDAAASPSLSAGWQPYDSTVIAQARKENRGVFVDYTAAWCITCQVNKKLVLDTAPIQEIFQKNDVLLIRADWTNHDPDITAALAELGRNSVPVYAWYAPGASAPELLPQILQDGMIETLFAEN